MHLVWTIKTTYQSLPFDEPVLMVAFSLNPFKNGHCLGIDRYMLKTLRAKTEYGRKS